MFNTSKTIQKLMIDRDITPTKLANMCGLHQSSVSRALQKSDNDYRISFLNQLVSAMGCNIRIQIIDSESQEVLYTISDTKTD